MLSAEHKVFQELHCHYRYPSHLPGRWTYYEFMYSGKSKRLALSLSTRNFLNKLQRPVIPASSDKTLSISRGSTTSSSGAFTCETCRRTVEEELDAVERIEPDTSASLSGVGYQSVSKGGIQLRDLLCASWTYLVPSHQ